MDTYRLDEAPDRLEWIDAQHQQRPDTDENALWDEYDDRFATGYPDGWPSPDELTGAGAATKLLHAQLLYKAISSPDLGKRHPRAEKWTLDVRPPDKPVLLKLLDGDALTRAVMLELNQAFAAVVNEPVVAALLEIDDTRVARVRGRYVSVYDAVEGRATADTTWLEAACEVCDHFAERFEATARKPLMILVGRRRWLRGMARWYALNAERGRAALAGDEPRIHELEAEAERLGERIERLT